MIVKNANGGYYICSIMRAYYIIVYMRARKARYYDENETEKRGDRYVIGDGFGDGVFGDRWHEQKRSSGCGGGRIRHGRKQMANAHQHQRWLFGLGSYANGRRYSF